MDEECPGFFMVVKKYLDRNYLREEELIWLTDMFIVHHHRRFKLAET